jgi:hypothetical protein
MIAFGALVPFILVKINLHNHLVSPLAIFKKQNNTPSDFQDLHNLLNASHFDESNINSTDGGILTTLKNGQQIIFSDKNDLGSQVASLQLILSRLTIEGKSIHRVDFRFNNPVVSY